MPIRRLAALLLAAATLVLTGSAVPAAAAAPLPPGHDPFYRYTGADPLGHIAPGTVLKKRTIQVALGSNQTPVPAEQLLYRTTGELGQPTVTVTTVMLPPSVPAVPRIVDYLSFYDALGAQCDPSYTLQGGDPGAPNRQQTEEEEALILFLITQGYVVTVPDFEGENLDWTAGHEAGYGALDALTATEHYLGAPASTPVAMTGYSGGSIAADWASELAPSYAPHLNIIGVAEGGIPVDYAHNLPYINGSQGWSGILPATLVALARAYDLPLKPYASAYGMKLAAQVQDACIGSFNGAYPGLKIQQLLKPRYADILKVRPFVRIIDNLIMGTVPGHPVGPLLMAVGDADGTGDGVMVTADVEGLAHEYCQQGVPVQLQVYQGTDHVNAGIKFEEAAFPFLQERFAGLPFANGCSSVPRGNSLAPVPMPKKQQSAPSHHRRRSTSNERTPAATGTGTLASTGGRAALPLVAVLLIAVAVTTAAVLRRRTAGTAKD